MLRRIVISPSNIVATKLLDSLSIGKSKIVERLKATTISSRLYKGQDITHWEPPLSLRDGFAEDRKNMRNDFSKVINMEKTKAGDIPRDADGR